jgi:hypothetical protein
MYCDKDKCPTHGCKEIYRLHHDIYKTTGD